MTTDAEREQWRREWEERDRKHAELLASLTIPEWDGEGTFEGRTLSAQWVKAHKGNAITGTSGWTIGVSEEVAALLKVGDPYIVEERGNMVLGWIIDGRWYDRKSDEELQAEHDAWKANWEQQKRDSLAQNREAWQKRQDALPEWVRARLENFHQRGGDTFALDGWGYELTIAELAVEYEALGDVILDKNVFEVSDHESEAIKRISREEGTSGNQHSVALALAKAHLKEPERSMGGTVSALSPISGDQFYEKDAE